MSEYKATIPERISSAIMRGLEDIAFGGSGKPAFDKLEVYNYGDNKWDNYHDGAAQDSFLMTRKQLEDLFNRRGYIKKTDGDYGLVKQAVGNKKYPIYLTSPDEASREELVFSTNNEIGNLVMPSKGRQAIPDPGNHPWALYINGKTGKPFAKEWDLNNYGDDANGRHGSTISRDNSEEVWPGASKSDWRRLNIARKFGNILDKVGSPVVVTSGYTDVTPEFVQGYYDKHDYTRDLNYLLENIRVNYGNKNSIYPHYELTGNDPTLTLSEITVIPQRKSGGKLNYFNYFK